MFRKFSAVSALVVGFAFLAVSVAHACAGLDSLQLRLEQSVMSTDRGDSPSADERSQRCKSVRASLLSAKPPMPAADSVHHALLSLQPSVETSPLIGASLVSSPGVSAFHPVYKRTLSISYLVLRI
jgi:hypothetical protein